MDSLIGLIGDQATFKVLRALLLSFEPPHLRDLATVCNLSPAGISDILRRLKQRGVLRESRQKNKKHYSLIISAEERDCFQHFFELYEKFYVQVRAHDYSKSSLSRLAWMDETYSFFKSVKVPKS